MNNPYDKKVGKEVREVPFINGYTVILSEYAPPAIPTITRKKLKLNKWTGLRIAYNKKYGGKPGEVYVFDRRLIMHPSTYSLISKSLIPQSTPLFKTVFNNS